MIRYLKGLVLKLEIPLWLLTIVLVCCMATFLNKSK